MSLSTKFKNKLLESQVLSVSHGLKFGFGLKVFSIA
jgi:hypothetical protein